MRRILGLLVAACFVMPVPTSAATNRTDGDAPARLAEAQAIIRIMFPPAERQQTMNKVMTAFSTQVRQTIPGTALSEPGLKKILDEAFDDLMVRLRPVMAQHMPQIFEATAIAYTHEFSLTELKDIHTFAESQSGRRYLSRSAALISDPAVAEANRAMMVDAQQMAQTGVRAMREKLIAYLGAHPELAAKITAEAKPKQ